MTSLFVAVAENFLNYSDLVLCYYMNATSQLQTLRSADVPNWYFERLVFPGERLLFEAPPAAKLEIQTSTGVTAIRSETIYCDRLQIDK